MISKERREMFSDLYRFAEYCENPPFKPGAIEENGAWFDTANREQVLPFLIKYKDMPLAAALAMAVYTEADRKAAAMNKM